ncbi:MAG: hypothetical protein Q7R41_11735, partial [Phycisphaerales bacterium]|nr:hypothetical protein [Phycisphaerales bacterium]
KNNTGTIRWRETTRDLTSLRLLTFVGGASSEIVRGQPVTENEIGVTRDVAGGPGSTVIVPVTVDLRPADQLKSLQFRVEVWPNTLDSPMIPEKFRALSISTNDFIPVVTAAEAGGPATFGVAAYTNGLARGLAVTFLGTNANLSVKDFAAVAMVAVPIPAAAAPGSSYNIGVFNPSGTADGAEASVALRSMASRQIRVANIGYMVGDSSPATWYNADQVEESRNGSQILDVTFGPYGFGNRALENSDVNNVFAAALGVRVPYSFTDLFDSMDAFPEDNTSAAGGDGLIRFLDWQIILRRSLGLDATAWRRDWTVGGFRMPSPNLNSRPNSPAESLSATSPNAVWQRHASIDATPVENV